MAQRRRRVRKTKRSKAIRLNKQFWLRQSKEIQLYREELLRLQGGVCAVTGIPLEVGALDHKHADGVGNCPDGAVRGVLLSEANTLEGKYLKLFKKMKMDTKYGLTFPEFLINLGTYLQEDYSDAPLHFKYMDDFRKHVSRWRNDTIERRLLEDFNIRAEKCLLKRDLVQIYVQAWVDEIETNLEKGELDDIR